MTKLVWQRIAACCLLALFTLCVAVAPANAQQTLGSINGTVLDSTGAAVGGATVTVTNTQIDLTRSTTAQGNGFFQIFNLPIGTYQVKVTHEGFETTNLSGITVQEARATTINASLKIGQVSQSVEVTANPLLNATDATNGYTLDAAQIANAPLATGSFTQLATLSPGVNAELLSGMDSNAGLGNQPIWANGQRSSSNTFQVNGVDVSNIFNGQSSSSASSQRYNFNIGGGSTSSGSSAGSGTIAGANLTSISVYGSIGNSLPSPSPEMTEELRVNTSMYDAQQGATSGAQIDVSTKSGTNQFHGQAYGMLANSDLNASPFYFKQAYLLSLQGVGAFPESEVVPGLHRWIIGGTIGGPLWKDKLFFFLAYQHLGVSDQSTALSQLTVPSGLTDDRSTAGLDAAYSSYADGAAFTKTISPIASALLNAKLPNGQYMIPSAQSTSPYQYGVPNVTLIGTSVMTGDLANLSLDYNATARDRVSVKLFYQNDPTQAPFAFSQVNGFPVTQNNGGDVIAIDNTTQLSPRLNWEQRLGYSRMRGYDHYNQTVQNTGGDPNFGVNASPETTAGINVPFAPGLPGMYMESFANEQSSSPGLKVGPYSSFANMGFTQNRLNPSSNLIWSVGKHTIVAGGGYSYTQLNINNNRTGLAQVETENFADFLEGEAYKSNVLESIDQTDTPYRNLADRYYRSNEVSAYLQDKWQIWPNLSITAGVRYDYHGGLTEKYGNVFNFDSSLYNVTGDTTTGFTVVNPGFVVAGNNKYYPTANTSDSTLTGRQWGVSPRIGFAWAPKQNHGNVVFRGGAGIYYDRGELFSYLSQPAGSGNGGPFGVTEAAPLATYVTGNGKSLSASLGTATTSAAGYVSPNANPATISTQLQTLLNGLTGESAYPTQDGKNCQAIDNQASYTDCPTVLNFGAYDKKNVLPYTMNFTFNVQWQPTSTLAVTLGYTGNLGRHAVIPFPLNEPGIATPSNPIHGETATYGMQVLDQNSVSLDHYGDDDYNSIPGEPWNTEDGGNTDFRVPYVGYSPNAADFKTAGTSSYNALESHLEKRFSHHFQAGVSYTFSHTLDEQSDIGLFFTGNNPNNLRQSYASSDFDRTHVFSSNFEVEIPDTARPHSALSYFTNDWHLNGIGILQSGEPYSLYEFYGAVGSIYFGNYPTLLNPILPIKTPQHPNQALTGNSGKFRGTGGSYMPTIDPTQIDINYVTPGTDGVPLSTGNSPQDIYETDFAPTNQRNIFRQGAQRRLDLSLTKTFKPTQRVGIEYRFNVFNVTNTMSPDVPQNQTEIRAHDACSNSAIAAAGAPNYYNCNLPTFYINYGQIATSSNPADQQSAKANLDQIPYVNGTGKQLTVPTQLPVGTTNSQGANLCISHNAVTGPNGTGCPNNGANFGSVTDTIGSPRMISMSLHITF